MRFGHIAACRRRLLSSGSGGDIGGDTSSIQYGRTAGFNAGSSFDYFVSPTGNDTTGDGSFANPYATATKANAVALAAGGNRSIGFRSGKYREKWDFTASNTRIAPYNGEQAIFSGATNVTGWAQCSAGDSGFLGSNYASVYKATVSTAGWSHSAYNALIPTENGTRLDLVQKRRDVSDLFEQTDDGAFYRVDKGDTITIGTDGSGFATTITHAAVLSAYTDAQLANCAVMLLADPNVCKVIDVTSASGGVLTLASNTNQPDLTPSGGAYSLLNIGPEIAQGQWLWVNNGDGTITLYVWPYNAAGLATTGIDIATRDKCVTVTGDGCTVEGFIFEQCADASIAKAPLHINDVTGITVRENLFRNYSHQQKGYGGLYGMGGTNYLIFNNEWDHGQNQFGFFLAKSSALVASGHRVHNNRIYRTSQTGPRFYGQSLVAFVENWIESCGVAAHANKINFYEGCDRYVVARNMFVGCGGYATLQEASRGLWLCNVIPMGPGATDTSRAFDDQGHTTPAPTDPAENYVINNLFPPAGSNPASSNSVQLVPDVLVNGQKWTYLNNVDGGLTINATYLTAANDNVHTRGTAIGARDVVTTAAAIFSSTAAEDYSTPPGSILTTKAGSDATAIIVIYEAWFPDLDLRKDVLGRVWAPATPGVGPFGIDWPLAA